MNIRNIIKQTLMRASALMHNNRTSKILYYHDVYSTVNYKALDADICMGTPLEMFKRHVDVIRKEGYEITPRISQPKNQVAIMFDDGFRGIYECREFFYAEKIYPTIFLPSDFIGNTSKGIMSENEILELQQHGFIFECHGSTHRPLTEVNDTELYSELTHSKKKLSEFLGKQINAICLPLGFFSEKLLERIREAGYTDVYSSIPGDITQSPHGMFPRNLCQFATPKEVRLILRGGNEMLKSRYENLHNRTNK